MQCSKLSDLNSDTCSHCHELGHFDFNLEILPEELKIQKHLSKFISRNEKLYLTYCVNIYCVHDRQPQ